MANRFNYNRNEHDLATVCLKKLISRVVICFIVVITFTSHEISCVRMVRLCIASVDPVKLSSQCVMCNRKEFPLTVIDCTGMTKVNELISNPLSVQEATCLIFNCRRQVPDVKPEPYHGSVSSAMRTNYPIASGTRVHEAIPNTGMIGGYASSPYMARYGLGRYGGATIPQQYAISQTSASSPSMYAAASRGLIGGPSLFANGQQLLPYAIVPAPYTSIFGSRKYKAALVPLFERRMGR